MKSELDDYPECDYCGAVPDHHPWHGSGMIAGVESRHIHACDECRGRLPARQQARPMDKLKEACTSFYYWWHNQPGQNTQEGFDEWIKDPDVLRMLHTTPPAQAASDVSMPRLSGIGRDAGHPRAVVLYLGHEPSDDDLRTIQEMFRTAHPAPTGPDVSDLIEFVRECTASAGTMVNGNRLCIKAKALLASLKGDKS